MDGIPSERAFNNNRFSAVLTHIKPGDGFCDLGWQAFCGRVPTEGIPETGTRGETHESQIRHAQGRSPRCA
jgi:hypothetical protein